MAIRIAKSVQWTKLGEEVVILNSSSGRYYSLDPVGSRAWCLMVEGLTVDEIVSTMLREFAAEEQQLRTDLRELIENLVERFLVLVSDKAAE